MITVITVIIFAPPAMVIAMWLGRKAQKKVWHYDLPYEERVKLLGD